MSLMKWFRRNNKKIMAIVVIILLIGFLGGSYFSRLAQRRTGIRQTLATFADGRKITNYDLALARQELEILKTLRADVILKGNTQDLYPFLLGELLFPERNISPLLLNRMKQTIKSSGLRITDKQLDAIYKTGISRDLLWLLLTTEAEQAGIRIANQRVRSQLGQSIPQLFTNVTYQQVIGSIMQRSGVPEEQIVNTFGKVLAVLIYAREVCSNENITSNQLSQMASYQQEMVNVELVRFGADLFENPFGFGYRLPDMARLEYIFVKMDDVSGIVSEPEPEEVEDYYQRQRLQYTTSVPSDPNDPNSPMVQKQRSYAEVANLIADQLLQRNINLKADEIIQQAKTLTESALESAELDIMTASAEQVKEYAGDYEQAAEKLSDEYKIPVYAGQTGLLSASDMMKDRYLGMMSVGGQSLNLVRLTQFVFAMDELQGSELGLFDIAKPKMYQNIGPTQDFTGQIVALLRIMEAQKSVEPDNIDFEFDQNTILVDQQDGIVYSVKEKVIQDLKKLAAFDVAETKAGQFKERILTEEWDKVIKEFNVEYKQQKGLSKSDPNVFMIENLANLRRIPEATMDILKAQSEGSPGSESLIEDNIKRKLFVDKLYELVPSEEDNLKTVPAIMESRSEMNWYIIRNITINRFYQEDYQQFKAQESYREDFFESQNLAVIHFNPDNVLKRMNFKAVLKTEQVEDVNAPSESSGRS
ncbi:MAG: hypothetical protein ACYST2_00055 [Planctomycetota bacterium]|jgi:hypothetical protein